MSKPKELYKTTIVIWTDYDPAGVELEDLAREATSGDALCDGQGTEKVTDPEQMPDTDFFGIDEDDQDENQDQ